MALADLYLGFRSAPPTPHPYAHRAAAASCGSSCKRETISVSTIVLISGRFQFHVHSIESGILDIIHNCECEKVAQEIVHLLDTYYSKDISLLRSKDSSLTTRERCSNATLKGACTMKRIPKALYEALKRASDAIVINKKTRYYFMRQSYTYGNRTKSFEFVGYGATKFAREIGHHLVRIKGDNKIIFEACEKLAKSGLVYDSYDKQFIYTLPSSLKVTIEGNCNKSLSKSDDRAKVDFDFIVTNSHFKYVERVYRERQEAHATDSEVLRSRVGQ